MSSACFRLSLLFVVIFSYGAIRAQVLREYLGHLMQLDRFSGSILISKGEEVIFHGACGLANVKNDIAITTKTKFRLSSITKQFTSMAIMILQERGQLNIDHPIGLYLTGYPNGDKITIRHLLTHMSGLFCFTKDGDQKRYRDLSIKATYVDEIINMYSWAMPNFAPGSQFRYCNYGYVLLAKIIENITHKRFGDFLRENIWNPLEMYSTGIDYCGSDCAVGYEKFGVPVEYFNVACVLGAADMYSTTGDLYKWHLALRENARKRVLVNPGTLKQIFTPASAANNGLGWFVYPLMINGKGHRCTAHMGGIRGVRTMITRFIDDDVCLIVLSNLETVSSQKISEDLARIILEGF